MSVIFSRAGVVSMGSAPPISALRIHWLRTALPSAGSCHVGCSQS